MDESQTERHIDGREQVTEEQLKDTAQVYLDYYSAEEMAMTCSQLFHDKVWHDFQCSALMEKYHLREKYFMLKLNVLKEQFDKELQAIHGKQSTIAQQGIAEAFEATKPEKTNEVIASFCEHIFRQTFSEHMNDPDSVLKIAFDIYQQRRTEIARRAAKAKAKKAYEEKAIDAQKSGKKILDATVYREEEQSLLRKGTQKRGIAGIVANKYGVTPKHVRELRKRNEPC